MGEEIVKSFFFSSRRRHTRYWRDWSSDVCSSDLPILGVVAEPMLPGKASKRVAYAPVPKPTQVGEWRTLRRSSELWLRNSANCPRNFGRRGALDGEGLAP